MTDERRETLKYLADGHHLFRSADHLRDCVGAALAEIDRLSGELAAERKAHQTTIDRWNVKLKELTTAGTPYWHERDAMNTLAIENQRLALALEAELNGPFRVEVNYPCGCSSEWVSVARSCPLHGVPGKITLHREPRIGGGGA